LLAFLLALVVLAGVALGGVAWYFSGAVLAVDHSAYLPQRATPGPAGTVEITKDQWSQAAGRYGLRWAGGYGTVGPVTGQDGGTVTRPFTPVSGALGPDTPAWVDPFAFSGDPRSARGLAFEEVTLTSDAGHLPTWVVPGAPAPVATAARPWVVFVHGRGGTRAESLRYLPTWHDLGLTVLVPSYRNDVGAAPSPDGRYHLGDTEWRDAEVAVRYALDHGAGGVVLAGWSMGGAISLAMVDRSPLGASVRGVVLDSPVLDWRHVLAAQGRDRGLPAPVTALAVRTVEARIGIDLDRFDWVARSGELKVPILLFHSDADTFVPDGPSVAVARARPDLVTFVRVPNAEHTRAWNVDPQAYQDALAGWVVSHGLSPELLPATG
jgi:dienelactone hydrolase